MSSSDNKAINQLPDELQPCHHMTNLVSQRSEDSLSGPAKWYTDFHVMTCPSCKAALSGLRELRTEVACQIQETRTDRPRLSEEEWHEVEEGWTKAGTPN
jgi:hypothetical protein